MKKILALVSSICAFVLECLPWGVVLYFANPEGDPYRETFSYFSMLPYGYGHFFWLFTAILTVLLVLFSLLNLFLKKKKIESTALLLSIAATIFSVCPLLQGLRNFTWIGLCVTLCLGGCIALLWKKELTK